MTENPTTPPRRPSALVFLKAPRPGEVKTRLAEGIGREEACRIYRRLAEAQLNRIPESFAPEIHFSPADAVSEMRTWLGGDRVFYPQADGGLGERLIRATNSAFQRGASEVLCLGGDCPGLTARLLESAATELRSGADLVLGPCEDGGYYLIAMRSPQPDIFRNIPWSSPKTLAATRAKAETLGLRVSLLQTLYDIDGVKDLERARAAGLL